MHKNVRRFCFIISVSLLLSPSARAAQPFTGYLFTYFTGNSPSQEQIRFAVSEDGKHFSVLNNDNPVITASSSLSETGGFRDPHIYRGADNNFYLVATDMASSRGWASNRGLVMMKSSDMINWSSVAINFQRTWAGNEDLNAVWAPETIHDELTGKNMVYFSLWNGNAPHKVFYSMASDNFTSLDKPRQLFFSPANASAIDADITKKDDKFYLITKNESGNPGIKIAVSDHLAWGYTMQTQDDVQQTSDPVEGPAVYKLNDGSGYILMYDKYATGGFQLTRTTDFKTFTAIDSKDTDINLLSPRHGALIPLTAEEMRRLKASVGLVNAQPAALSIPYSPTLWWSESGRAEISDKGTLRRAADLPAEIWSLSSDGRVAVGDAYTDNDGNNMHAVVWSGENLSDVRDIAQNTGASKAYAVSGDGNVVAGIAHTATGRLHATVWNGSGWRIQQDLGTLTGDGSGTSGAYALSSDGKIVAGESSVTGGTTHAVLWSGPGWQEKTDLGTLRKDNTGMSWGYAISDDGKTVGGYSDNDSDVYAHATLWTQSGINKTDLGTLRSDNTGPSVVRALSSGGDIAAGSAITENGYVHGVVWSGVGWKQKTDLGTLRADDAGSSFVRAVSADGRIIGGSATTESGEAHGAVWSGHNWSVKTDLGTLRKGNAGVSEVQALSDNGTVAAGYSDTDAGVPHAALWKIDFPEENTRPPVIVDRTNTIRSVYKLGNDTFAAMEFQRRALSGLQQDCVAENQAMCWSVSTGITAEEGKKDTLAGFLLGYGLSDNLTAGIALNHSLYRSVSSDYNNSSNNLGAGIFFRWHIPFAGGEWYLKPAASFSNYNADVRRSAIEGTEAGTGNSRIKASGISVEGGQSYRFENDVVTGWHVGVRTATLTRKGYQENNGVHFPMSYQDVNWHRTSAYTGADIAVPLTHRLKWISGIEVDRSLNSDTPVYEADGAYIGQVRHRPEINRITGVLKSGVMLSFDKNMSLSLMPSVSRNALGGTSIDGLLSLNGLF